MYVFNRITVNPQLPKRIGRINEIANNLWWAWNTEFLQLFKMIDLEFTSEALKDFVNKNIYSNNNITKIQKAVADHYNITIEDLKGKKRSNKVAHPRQLAMYLCRVETDETFPRIGLEFGGRDHSTVIFACDKIEKELLENHELEQTIKEIKAKL